MTWTWPIIRFGGSCFDKFGYTVSWEAILPSLPSELGRSKLIQSTFEHIEPGFCGDPEAQPRSRGGRAAVHRECLQASGPVLGCKPTTKFCGVARCCRSTARTPYVKTTETMVSKGASQMSQDEKKVIHYVNDGLNRALRGNPPPRERPPDSEKPRYENYWQARPLGCSA